MMLHAAKLFNQSWQIIVTAEYPGVNLLKAKE